MSNTSFRKPPLGLFITGTDTEVGKTYVSALIVKALVAAGHRVGVYIPTASDCVSDGRQLISEDSVALWDAAGRPLSLAAVCPQRFQAAMAPYLSAKAEGRGIDANLLRAGISVWADECDIVVVRGAGGLMTPVTEDEFAADIAYDFGYPVVVVAPNVLGVINQTLQTLVTASCFRDGLPVAGVVLNDSQCFDGDVTIDSNQEAIASRSVAPILSRVRYEATEFDNTVDWMALAKAGVESGGIKSSDDAK